MAKGVDELVNHVLSEVALTGVQGAGSADFKRFVQAFYKNLQNENGPGLHLQSGQLGPAFYEKVWQWVSGHKDIRITHNGATHHYTLAEFETAEKPDAAATSTAAAVQPLNIATTVNQTPGPANSLLALGSSVRQRLMKEGLGPRVTAQLASSKIQTPSTSDSTLLEEQTSAAFPHDVRRGPRVLPSITNDVETVFDDPPMDTTVPRLYASQNRIWQALTGHSVDLKKVPAMEFVLLSLIASHGVNGVTQPDLTVMSGQDKRSVPHRTDELCRKGYIEKRPVQSGKLRTSLCVHKKFVSDDHFLTSGKVEDVFQYKKFVLSGFVHLLYNTLKDAGVVPTRDIRKRLNVPMSTWNKRAVQGALIRLDQTGMIKRFRARRKDAEDNWLTCIEVLREPRPEDHENLKFRRQVTLEEVIDEQSDEEVDDDTLMRDLEVDMLNSDSKEADGGQGEAGRVPPQWVPERLLSNILYDVVAMGGPEGWDAGMIRDRIMGKFWRRPMESYLTRLTDDWEKTQPNHLRHLALIRDTRNTQEKKFVHYVYRTYENFQKAVDAGDVIWAGVSKPMPEQSSTAKGGRPKKDGSKEQLINPWGFRTISSKDFLNKDGSGSLSECRTGIVHGRKYGPRWDNSLVEDIGYHKVETPKDQRIRWTNDMSRSNAKKQAKLDLYTLMTPRPGGSSMTPSKQEAGFDVASESENGTPVPTPKVMGLPKRKHDSGLLTIEQRIALGLKPKGRLSKFVEDQIREHRKQTGDPASIPESIELERPAAQSTPNKSGPLMTKEERIAAGLPPRGRLGQKIEDQIREQRGLPKSVEKIKKPRNKSSNEPALLSKEQRIRFGIIPHGRLPQSLMEGLREEREFDIPLDQSRVIQAYLNAVNDKRAKAEITKAIDEVRVQTLREHDPSRGLYADDNNTPVPDGDDAAAEVVSTMSTPILEKRTADDSTVESQPLKRARIERDELPEEVTAVIPTPPSTASAGIEETDQQQGSQDANAIPNHGDDQTPVATGSPKQSSHISPTPPREISPVIDLAQVSAKVRLIQEKYSNRSSPGVYMDPFAKRRIGKGRPRNAFVATFRLPGLSTFDWFADNVTAVTERPLSSVDPQSSPPRAVPSPIAEPGKDLEDLGTEHNLETEDAASQSEPGAGPADFTTDSVLPNQQSSVQGDDMIEAGQSGNTPTGGQSIKTSSEQGFSSAQAVQQHARPVVGWNAINKLLQPPPTYQSPYALSDPPDPTLQDGTLPASAEAEQDEQDEQVESVTQTGADESQIQGVCGPISEVDTTNRSARKLAAYMGTKTGGGSQKMFRHKIIMQIIDLCNGVYPMHGEIGRPFTTLWKQQYPRTPPPNSSTVLSNLRDMIADPRNGLKKFSFLIRLRQSAGLKKKDMVVYQHLTPTSPQVMKLAYKMANHSNTKAHQYYPEEIRHLVSDESFYVPMPVAPKDETISLERLNPSLQNKIKEANLERRRRYYHKQKNEESARDAQNAAVEAPLKSAKVDGQPRVKRTRLASLNDKNKRYRRAPISNAPLAPMDPELEESIVEEASLEEDDPGYGQILVWKEPWIASIVRNGTTLSLQASEADAQAVRKATLVEYYASSITAPIVRFYATNGTFSTEFGLVRGSDLFGVPPQEKPLIDVTTKLKGTKRVRIVEPASQRPSKKARVGTVGPTPPVDGSSIFNPSEESEDSYSSSTSTSSSDDEGDTPLMQINKAQAKARAKAKAKEKKKQRRNRKDALPTLLERLTGLTGDPNDPIYLPSKPKSQSQKVYQDWSKRKARLDKQQRERKYAESQDPMDKFKKLCCTLVIAASMAGEPGCVDWSIVENVHSGKGFDLAKTKALWAWMQTNMAIQIAELTADFEDRFLEAYESNRIAVIEDPVTYDWTNLVRWAMHTCVYPEMNLPMYREALQQFIVDLSSFEVLDRPKWHREKIADRVRTQLQLQYPFTAPLHRPYALQSSVSETELKARSWIRVNTATPQALYDSKTAHEKLKTLGDHVLAKVVGEYVDRQMLRMRKLKRLLPGRNYTFTARLAKKYGRTFELEDFMAAVKIKKEMDAAFAEEDPNKRIYSVSRAEPDGAIMAIMSLLGEGKVKFVPKVPSVNNEFGAPLPRLSVWGFMEGDYVHRGIDRQRLFWDIHVVPTKTYDYGNPLQPASTPLSRGPTNSLAIWSPLPQPPLPGNHDSNALLPIWSSMDGQNITWPWWYRVLNLVLQPLIFQPGASIEDIHANCDEYTTESFEIELVLQWLVSVNAVKRTTGGGYITLPSVWAAFGDVLHDMEDDWLNAHVKRKHQKHEKQQWRDKSHLRYLTLQGRTTQRYSSDNSDESDMQTDDEREAINTSTDIMRHPKEQYATAREQIATATPEPSAADKQACAVEQTAQLAAAAVPEPSEAQRADVTAPPSQDAEMTDANEGHEMDAEGEMDV